MKGLILAGGKGTRLRPLTVNTPKPIVPVANVPFLVYQIDLMARAGIDEVILSLSYQPRKIEDLFKDGADYGIGIRYAVENDPLGTAGAFKNGEEHIDSTTVVFNGDIMSGIDLGKIIAQHHERKAVATIVLTPVENPSAYGLVETETDGRVRRFIEKPGPSEITTNMINAGMYVLEPSVLKYIPKGESYSFERGLFPKLLEKKEPFFAVASSDYWIDIGTPRKYLEVHHDILSGRYASPLVPPRASQSQDIPEDVRIDDRSIVHADVVLRKGVHIENSVIGRNCRIGEGVHIVDSVIWSSNTIDPDTRIHGAIIGKGCSIGQSVSIRAGAVIGDKTFVTDYSSL